MGDEILRSAPVLLPRTHPWVRHILSRTPVCKHMFAHPLCRLKLGVIHILLRRGEKIEKMRGITTIKKQEGRAGRQSGSRLLHKNHERGIPNRSLAFYPEQG